MARQQQANSADFREIGLALSSELVEDLNREHIREVEALYQEQMEIREELRRIIQLMQTEVLPREKQMHDMIERMHDAYEQATANMHEHLGNMAKGGLTDAQRQQKDTLQDPLKDMEDEVARIMQLLSHGEVRPDIAGWTPQRQAAPGSARSGTRAQGPASPGQARPQTRSQREASPGQAARAPSPQPVQSARIAQTFSLPDRTQPRLQSPVGTAATVAMAAVNFKQGASPSRRV